jgi:hypothetical protein
VRFTLLIASTLAASLALSACSSGGSQAIPNSGAPIAAPMSHSPQIMLVPIGPGMQRNTTSCPSSEYVVCYDLASPSTFTEEWCLSTSGNCTSGLLPGKWKWKNTTKVLVIKTGKPTKDITSKWSPKKGNPVDNDVTVKSGVGSTGGKPGYEFSFEACGKYKGKPTCPTATVGIIISSS